MTEKMSMEDMQRRLSGTPTPQGWKVGEVAYGYCGGYFGRDSYEDKVCIHVGFYQGTTYAVFCGEDYQGKPWFSTVSGDTLDQLEEYKTPEETED